jgi:hypothetical protein
MLMITNWLAKAAFQLRRYPSHASQPSDTLSLSVLPIQADKLKRLSIMCLRQHKVHNHTCAGIIVV